MFGETKLGNTTLVEYGVQTEQSDLRAHVCVLAKKVYVYRTEAGAAIAKERKLRGMPPKNVVTHNIITAQGYPVGIPFIPGVLSVDIPPEWLRDVNFQPTDSTSAKGMKAVSIVSRLIHAGQLPHLSFQVREATGKALQVSGTDIEVPALNTKVQVKCDWRGGVGDDCTGNLFLQIAECNPWSQT
jgi:hypothetical protein